MDTGTVLIALACALSGYGLARGLTRLGALIGMAGRYSGSQALTARRTGGAA